MPIATTSRLRTLLSLSAATAALCAGPALAQDTPQQTAEAAPAADQGTIVVTGSLITNPNLERSTPVNVTTSEEVELRQTNVAEQLLREVPGVEIMQKYPALTDMPEAFRIPAANWAH